MEKSKPKSKAGRKRKWMVDHNQRRRERYKADPEYREYVNQRNRESYRRNNNVRSKNIEQNFKLLNSIGRKRSVVVDFVKGKEVVQDILSFTVPEMALLLDINRVMIRQWVCRGVFPRPVVKRAGVLPTSPGGYLYSVGQAKRIMRIMQAHWRVCLMLRSDHTGTVAELNKALEYLD